MKYKMIALFIGASLLCAGCNWFRHDDHDHDDHDHTAMPFEEEEEEHDHLRHGIPENFDEHNHGHGHDDDDDDDDDHEGELHAGEIRLTHEQAEAAGLEVETVNPGPFRAVIHTGGMIQSAQGSEQAVAATSGGVMFFADPSLTEGASIRAGEKLVTISSDKLQDGDLVLKAKIEFEAAKQEYERAQKLIGDKIISQKEFNEIQARYLTAEASYLGQADNLSTSGISVTSPISGYIKKWLVQNGQYVSMGEPVAVVAQDRRLQLHADVTENNFKYLRYVFSANFKTAYNNEVYQLSKLNGKLLSYGKSAEEGSAYIPVTFEFDNVGDIVPGSFAEVFLLANRRENVISVPTEALVEEQGEFFVFLQLEEEVFGKKHVVIGQDDGTRVEILQGLEPGNLVVTKGAYSVKLASASNAIPEHSHSH